MLLIYAKQHAEILEAIQDGEPDAAAQRIQVHLEWALAHSKQEVRRRLGIEAVDEEVDKIMKFAILLYFILKSLQV